MIGCNGSSCWSASVEGLGLSATNRLTGNEPGPYTGDATTPLTGGATTPHTGGATTSHTGDATTPFATAGGQMAALINAADWSKTALGPRETWPQSLTTILRILVTSRYQMWLAWGRDLGILRGGASGGGKPSEDVVAIGSSSLVPQCPSSPVRLGHISQMDAASHAAAA
jgi:hypothetical protein